MSFSSEKGKMEYFVKMRKISLIIENFGKPLEFFFRIKSNLKYLLFSLTTIMNSQIEVAKTFNVFFSNIVKILKFRSVNVRTNYTVDYQVIQSYKQ